MRTALAAGTLTLTTAGLVGLSAPTATADDDFKKRSGSCSGASTYTMTLKDLDVDDRDLLRTTFAVNSKKGPGKTWNFTVKRGSKVVGRVTKRTDRYGNVRIARKLRGDDDTRVTVIARAGYGERCARTMKLDD